MVRSGLALLLTATACQAATAKLPPNPGLDASIRAADAIAEVEIVSGGPFRAAAVTRKSYFGAAPRVIELEGFNTVQGDTVHNGFVTGGRFVLFLSSTDRRDVFATLTPTAPRLAADDESVMLNMGDPPFNVPVKRADFEAALAAMLACRRAGSPPESGAALVRALWERNEVEARYLALALAAFLRDPRALPTVQAAARQDLLRMQLAAVEALQALATPEALQTLRGLIDSDRETVRREAVRALAGLEDLAASDAMLAWCKQASSQLALLPAGDPRQTRTLGVLNNLLMLIDRRGALLPPGKISPVLYDIARAKDTDATLAADALYLLGTFGGSARVPDLLALADDPVYAHRQAALGALFRATLRAAAKPEEFRAWWKENADGFGEAHKRALAEAAAKSIEASGPGDEVALQAATLRLAPAGIALVSAAPLLVREEHAPKLAATDLLAWRSPLAVPFLLERLGSRDEMERRIALEGLVRLAEWQPRLVPLAKPFVLSGLASEGLGLRREAAGAAGRLNACRAIPGLLDLARDPQMSESSYSARALYQLTARTLGHSLYESAREQEAAMRRLEGWWRGLDPQTRDAWTSPLEAAAGRTVYAAPADLDTWLAAEDSHRADAAFAVAFEHLPPAHAVWKTLRQAQRPRGRAYGIAALYGAGPEAVTELQEALALQDAPLPAAHALVALASLEKGAGLEALLAWLQGPGAKAAPFWRRLATLSLAWSDGEARSLKALGETIAKLLASEQPPAAGGEKIQADPGVARAALVALAARQDGTPVLVKALGLSNEGLREMALRALIQRRAKGLNAMLLGALAGLERYAAPDVAMLLAPMLEQDDARVLRAMLAKLDESALLAALLFERRPDLAGDAESRAALIKACGNVLSATRRYAAGALARLRSRAAIPALLDLVRDTDSQVAAAAAEALALLGDKEGCRLAEERSRVLFRRDLRWFKALGVAGSEEGLEELLQLSKSKAWSDGEAGLSGLGVCERTEALDRLLEVFRDMDSEYRSMAAEALAGQGDAAVAALAGDLTAQDAAKRGRALHVLASIRTQASAHRLLAALDDEDPRLRALADWALRRITDQDAAFEPEAGFAERKVAAERWRKLAATLER